LSCEARIRTSSRRRWSSVELLRGRLVQARDGPADGWGKRLEVEPGRTCRSTSSGGAFERASRKSSGRLVIGYATPPAHAYTAALARLGTVLSG
jgi:hypothetical protein